MSKTKHFFRLQDDMLDDDDRLILDRSPDEMGSQDNDLDDEIDSDDDLEGTTTSEGERIIYPWMKKIHVAGVGKYKNYFDAILQFFFSSSHAVPFLLLSSLKLCVYKKISTSSSSSFLSILSIYSCIV